MSKVLRLEGNGNVWKELNETVTSTTDGDIFSHHLFSFNVRFELDDVIKLEDSTYLTDNEKAALRSEGFEYTDASGLGLAVEFKTVQGDVLYRTGAITDDY